MMKIFEGRFEVAWYVLAFVVICFYLAVSEEAVAGERSFNLHVVSEHFDDTDNRSNENNLGIGYTYITDYSNIGYTVGMYKNSHYKTSTYIGGVYKPYRYLSFSLLAITGYEDTVLLAPTVNIHLFPNSKIKPMFTSVPTDSGFVTLLSIEWRLGPE